MSKVLASLPGARSFGNRGAPGLRPVRHGPDEPTSGVDRLARYRFWWLIRRLAQGGMSIWVNTHNLDEVA